MPRCCREWLADERVGFHVTTSATSDRHSANFVGFLTFAASPSDGYEDWVIKLKSSTEFRVVNLPHTPWYTENPAMEF